MADIIKKISMPDTLNSMRVKSTLRIPYNDIKMPTAYNAVRTQNAKCGWKQWTINLVTENGKSCYRIVRNAPDSND